MKWFHFSLQMRNRTSTGCRLQWYWFRAILRCFNGCDQAGIVSVYSTALARMRRRWQFLQGKLTEIAKYEIDELDAINWNSFKQQSSLIWFTFKENVIEIGLMDAWKVHRWLNWAPLQFLKYVKPLLSSEHMFCISMQWKVLLQFGTHLPSVSLWLQWICTDFQCVLL